MNKERRKRIADTIKRLDALGAIKDEIAQEIADLEAEEREAFENLSENLQQGEKGQAMEAAADALQAAADALENLDIDEIRGNLETAAE